MKVELDLDLRTYNDERETQSQEAYPREAEALRIVFRGPQWPASTLGEGEASCSGERSEADVK